MQRERTRLGSQRAEGDHHTGSAGDNLLQKIVFIDCVAVIDTQVVNGVFAAEGAGDGDHGIGI